MKAWIVLCGSLENHLEPFHSTFSVLKPHGIDEIQVCGLDSFNTFSQSIVDPQPLDEAPSKPKHLVLFLVPPGSTAESFGLERHIVLSIPKVGTNWRSPTQFDQRFASQMRKTVDRCLGGLREISALIWKDYGKSPLLLPEKSFTTDQWDTIRNIIQSFFADPNRTKGRLRSQLEAALAHFNKVHLGPKDSRKGPKCFYDNGGLQFWFGQNDRHGGNPAVENGCNPICVTNARFRFGVQTDTMFHYDLTRSEDQSMEGVQLRRCHGQDFRSVTSKRLNIWQNDFWIEKN